MLSLQMRRSEWHAAMDCEAGQRQTAVAKQALLRAASGMSGHQALRSRRTRLHGGAVVPRLLIGHQLPENHACTARDQGAQHVCRTLLRATAGFVEGNDFEAGDMAQQQLSGRRAA